MRLGLIAYQNNRGLGTQTWEYYNHLKPYRTMVIDNETSRGFEQYPERYPDAWKTIGGLPSHEDCDQFVNELDVILMAENAPTYYLLDAARIRGVKTVTVPNFEFYGYIRNPSYPRPDLFMCPSMWHFDEVHDPKKFVPVPIVPRLTVKPTVAKSFLHIAGKRAAHDRNGTGDLFRAMKFIKSDIKITIKCQHTGFIEELMEQARITIPANVEVVIDISDTRNYWDNYIGYDAMIMPRRYGGLCLPVNEALGAGMPVIMPDISPNNTWLPKEWLVSATKQQDFLAHNEVEVFETHTGELARLIDRMATEPDFYERAIEEAAILATQNSWEKLLPTYIDTLQSVI